MRDCCNHSSRDFRPELLSRRGELLAWVSALLVGGAWMLLVQQGRAVHPAVPFLAVFLWLAALSISLGNWVDRRTLIRIEEDGITFQNGLRNVRLGWNEIMRVQVRPSNWGKAVEVLGKEAHFTFRTLGEVRLQGEVRGRLGFAHGEHILQQIITRGGLRQVQHLEAGEYYARQ